MASTEATDWPIGIQSHGSGGGGDSPVDPTTRHRFLTGYRLFRFSLIISISSRKIPKYWYKKKGSENLSPLLRNSLYTSIVVGVCYESRKRRNPNSPSLSLRGSGEPLQTNSRRLRSQRERSCCYFP
ncbi:hypothetical protein LOK49_LG11G02778 [Camellia lanceoleosa]|uniref:Uncharacterized protein n=1 Tax=Camellia lanceoleosa TaxID=1840588 RepID=A0ACC0G2U9_9ERIC|nr:hypothetical protein LOK49_LG11G02778 [Camellia lanceoleosa]